MAKNNDQTYDLNENETSKRTDKLRNNNRKRNRNFLTKRNIHVNTAGTRSDRHVLTCYEQLMQYGHQFMTFVYFTICIALPERRSPFLSALLASKFSLLSSGEDALPFVFCFVAAIFFLRDVSVSNDVVVTSEFAPFFRQQTFFRRSFLFRQLALVFYISDFILFSFFVQKILWK